MASSTSDDPAPQRGKPVPIRRRAHPSQGARMVALAASLAATGGVAGALAAAEHASSTETVGPADPPATTATTTPRHQTVPAPAAAPATTVPATSAGRYSDGVWAGTAQFTRWGDVQVRATVQGGRLVDVELVEAPSDRRSASINSRAQVTLEAEALAEQGATLDIVSGATYTSRTYAASLQAALDAAAR